jgi:hypothetical protein
MTVTVLNPDQEAALDRLGHFYDGQLPYDPNTNPGGMRNGGHRKNFVPALADVATAVLAVADFIAVAIQTGTDVTAAAAIAQPLLDQAIARLQDALQAVVDAEAARDRAEAASGVLTGDFKAQLKGTLLGLPTEPPSTVGEPWLNHGVLEFKVKGLPPGATTPVGPPVHLVTSDELDAHKRFTRALSFAFH